MINWKSLAIICLSGATLLTACGGSDSRVKTSKAIVTNPMSEPQRNRGKHHSVGNAERFAGTLHAHNAVRQAHNLQPLIWSDSLAAYAQEWANHLANSSNCKMRHRPNGGRFKQQYGENLWWASPRVWSDGMTEVQNITIDRVVKDWADEKPFYNYRNNSCQRGEQCGHYTQLVWRETTEVGCAYQQCSDKSQLWVCNYNPPGNYIGERPY